MQPCGDILQATNLDRYNVHRSNVCALRQKFRDNQHCFREAMIPKLQTPAKMENVPDYHRN